MPVETEMLCEVWEEELLAPCTSSELYCLEPIGIRTPMVESLTSYISRLANAHSVLLRTLVTDEILPNLNRTHLYQEGRPVYDHLTTFWKRSAMLNGTCSTASNWVHAIEQLTQRNDLRFLTMLTFANVLSWRGLVRPTQAWCPLCYEEWRKTGQMVYQPLIWQLSVIYYCPQHQVPLRSSCPYKNCRRLLLPLAPHFQPGYCMHCNRWLGTSFESEDCQAINRDEQEWQAWLERAVGDLLATAPYLSFIPCPQVISTILSTHVHQAMEGNLSEFARRLHFHRRTVWEWTQGLQVPQLDALLDICAYFGINPRDLLTGNVREVAQVNNGILGKKPLAQDPRRQFRRFDAEKLRDALEQVLQSEEDPPPSMREVARRLNYNQSHLYKHFSNLCHAISIRYLAYLREQRRSRLRRTCGEVELTMRILSENDNSLSERQVGKMLRKRGAFKEEEVRTARKSAVPIFKLE